MKRSIFLVLIVLLSIACEKDKDIFSGQYSDMYGNWKLYGISGGFTGNGHELNFDLLLIDRKDKYSFIAGDNILEKGNIIADEQSSEGLIINFNPEDITKIIMYDPEKFVVFYGPDTLFLNSPCCDRYCYHLVRVK